MISNIDAFVIQFSGEHSNVDMRPVVGKWGDVKHNLLYNENNGSIVKGSQL